MKTLAELMSANPVVVGEDTPLLDCAMKLLERGFRHLPVVNEQGQLMGVLHDAQLRSMSELDIVMPPDSELVAGDLAGAVTLVAAPEDSPLKQLRRMVQSGKDVILVVDDARRVVGIVTEHDGLRLAQVSVDEGLRSSPCGIQPAELIERDAGWAAAWARMCHSGVRHLVVIDRGRIDGMVSYRDLIELGAPRGEEGSLASVHRGRRVVTTTPRTSVTDASRKMLAYRIGCLPVVEQGQVMGVILRSNVIKALVGALQLAEVA